MSPISVLVLLIAPITSHRLIVPPQVDNEWDSVVVSSDPIKITEGKKNASLAGREPDYAIRLNQNGLGETHAESRSSKNCKYNDISCLYGTEAPEPTKADNNQEIIDRFLEQYSSITNAKFGTGLENRTEVEEKSYWNQEKPMNHPFDDKKGWVTLDTVPWSTSLVSKWQPNVQPTHPSPSSFESDRPHRPLHPSEEKPWHYGGMSDKPTLQTWTTPMWTTNRPAPVTTNYGSYVPVSNHVPQKPPTSQWGIGNNDIITDNKPTNFPVGNGYQPFHSMSQQNHFHSSSSSSSSSYQEPHHTTPTVARPTRYPTVTRHPSTYPDAGNGEWVLLSTTKGYSLPTGYRGTGKTMHAHRPDISRYHEEEIDLEPAPVANRRSLNLASYEVNEENRDLDVRGLRLLHTENGSSIYAKDNGRRSRADWNMEEAPLQILYSSTNDREKVPAVTMRRSVRLQVLPPVSNTTTLSHGGLLEVDSNIQSVDEDHKALEEEKIKQLSKIAKVRRSNFTLYKVIPAPIGATSGKSLRDKSAAVLAAVGAGMIPATMAVLVPMALGRKKRSLPRKRFPYETETILD